MQVVKSKAGKWMLRTDLTVNREQLIRDYRQINLSSDFPVIADTLDAENYTPAKIFCTVNGWKLRSVNKNVEDLYGEGLEI